MRSYSVRNVNHYFPLMVNDIRGLGVPRKSRVGDVLEFLEPVTVTYSNPTERVLFNKSRMKNHFFEFMEGLWIISGANDVAFLHQFNKQMAQYSDDGKTFFGAYGFRLRSWFGADQIKTAIEKLRADPTDRRVVLVMWDAIQDLPGGKKDHPCNTHIYLKIRDDELHMTICCRSNDALYGQTGTNVVHFSMLQEYLAGRIGVKIGPMHTLSDSLHVYVDVPVWAAVKNSTPYVPDDPYSRGIITPFLMHSDADGWDDDLKKFMLDPFGDTSYRTEFFSSVAAPIAIAWIAHKNERNGLACVNSIAATDWRLACQNWLTVTEP